MMAVAMLAEAAKETQGSGMIVFMFFICIALFAMNRS